MATKAIENNHIKIMTHTHKKIKRLKIIKETKQKFTTNKKDINKREGNTTKKKNKKSK